jgi:hypothetical protein
MREGTWKRSYSLCVQKEPLLTGLPFAKVMNQMARARISPNLKYKE